MRIRWPLLARRTHKWLALLLGVQLLVWAATGFYMVAVHIDHVRGEHLVRAEAAELFDLEALVPASAVAARHPQASEIRLQRLVGRPVWRVAGEGGPFLIDGQTGERLPPLGEGEVRERARLAYAGEAPIASVLLLEEAPQEVQSRTPPFWQVEFEGWNRPTLYIAPETGEVLARRHAAWRVFDFAWMLHIMDYRDRTDANNVLLRAATLLSVPAVLSGAWMLLWAFPRRRRRKA